MSALTKAEARDVIRRDKLSKLTALEEWQLFQTGTNRAGDPASMFPTPTNAQIDSQLGLALDFINRKCHLGYAQDVQIEVLAQTANGPLAVSLRQAGAGVGGIGFGDVSSVKRAYYEEADGTTYRLLPRSREDFDRPGSRSGYPAPPYAYGVEIQQESPARSRVFWIEGYTLFIDPPPSTAGTLHLIAGTGIAFVGDAASLEVLPNDYHDIAWTCAAWFVARNYPQDAEMVSLAGGLQALALDGIGDILKWKRDVSAQQEDGVTPQSDRMPARRFTRNVSDGHFFAPRDY